jgi:hypothetical protein
LLCKPNNFAALVLALALSHVWDCSVRMAWKCFEWASLSLVAACMKVCLKVEKAHLQPLVPLKRAEQIPSQLSCPSYHYGLPVLVPMLTEDVLQSC